MAMDPISNQLSNTANLYRPVPMNKLQQNLSQYYDKTSGFVEKQFREMFAAEGEESLPKRKLYASDSEDSQEPRLNPQGVGQYVDIWI
jgi:hypothetical protein